MHIYYINKNSNLKGPFDITDAKGHHIISVGDICIQDTTEGLKVLYVVSNNNVWSHCKCLGLKEGKIGKLGNTLLFSFDGISKRYADVEVLLKLQKIFEEEPLISLFKCSIEIATYNRDFWDVNIFQKIVDCTSIQTCFETNKVQEEENKGDGNNPIFVTYLNSMCHNIFVECQNNKMSLRDTFKNIKLQHGEDFRKSLRCFLADYPDKSIYSVL